MKLIAGLGNPGQGYADNRHNVGFMCLNDFAREHDIKFDKKQGLARTGMGILAGNKVILAKPQTYMNESGKSISRLIARFNIALSDLLIIHDDLDLPTGKIRIRHGGSSGGHKGVQSICNELDSQQFTRLRIGIGRPYPDNASEDDIISYVLSDFTAEEKQVINRIIPEVSAAIFCFLTEGLTATMNKFN